jgi:hypothetical protein
VAGAFEGAGAAGAADAVGSTLGVAVAGEALGRPVGGGGLGLSAISATGFPRPSVATSSATAATAITAPTKSQRVWGMSP